jgi:carboxyl-terminal processing protease
MDERLPLERRLFIVSETFRLIEKAFIHWEDALVSPSELAKTVEMFFEKAVTAKTRNEFKWVMMELFGHFRNAHSWYYDRMAPKPDYGYLGFSMLEIGGQWLVNLDVTGVLQSGDIVISIEGKSPSEWFRKLKPYIGVVNNTSEQIFAQKILSEFIPNKTVKVEIEDQNHCRRSIILSRILGDDERFKPLNSPSKTEGKWLQEGKTAYIQIPSFGEPIYEERALELINEFQNASTLVIDVRGNGGGSTPDQLTKRLMDRPYRWWMERALHPGWLWQRHGGGKLVFADDYRFTEWQPTWTEPSEADKYYSGNIIVLTDRHVGSAAEDFIMPFKDNGRATIIGERTWGSTGQPIIREFGDDIQIGVGTIRAYFPNGDPFEGVGVVPDIHVTFTREDFYGKRDATLAKAMELLN